MSIIFIISKAFSPMIQIFFQLVVSKLTRNQCKSQYEIVTWASVLATWLFVKQHDNHQSTILLTFVGESIVDFPHT